MMAFKVLEVLILANYKPEVSLHNSILTALSDPLKSGLGMQDYWGRTHIPTSQTKAISRNQGHTNLWWCVPGLIK